MEDRQTNKKTLHLPEEIVEEILVRIPVKSVLRFRCVSKSWLSLIGSKRFIKTHLERSAHHRVFIYTFSDCKAKQCSLPALLAGNDLSPLCHPISSDLVIMGLSYNSCCYNGVLCLSHHARFVLYNPATRVSKALPKDPQICDKKETTFRVKIGLGWDESSGAYKVFASWKRTKGNGSLIWYRATVYSSKTKSWKTVKDTYLDVMGSEMVGGFVGGKLHWLGLRPNEGGEVDWIGRLYTISSFDVKSEVCGTVEMPVGTEERCTPRLGVFGGRLCLSAQFWDKKTFDAWVMKESWEKLFTIHFVYKPQHGLASRYNARVIGESANGEILISYDTSFLVYSPRNDVIRHHMEVGGDFQAHLYVESLVSPLVWGE